MITEVFLNIVFGIISGLLSLLPDFQWSVDTGMVGTFMDYVRMGCYLLPMNTVGTIVSLIFAIILIRIVIGFIKTIWELLPLV